MNSRTGDTDGGHSTIMIDFPTPIEAHTCADGLRRFGSDLDCGVCRTALLESFRSPEAPSLPPGTPVPHIVLQDQGRTVRMGDPLCVCTHPLSVHNLNRLCIALPGVLGCGCLGFQEAR